MAVKYRDYYEVLGVPRTASAEDIKRAYRRLARQHHPDLKPASERAGAAERFKEINEAYEVLGDTDKRARYDTLGAGYRNGSDFTPPPGGQGWSAPGPRPGEWEEAGDFSDFFTSLFGRPAGRGGRGGGRAGAEGVRVVFPGADVEAELPVTLADLLRGGRRRITLSGGRSLDVEIPPGTRDGTVLRLAGQGERGTGGGPPGDLFLHARLQPDPRYRVAGADLEVDLPLWPWQAVLGGPVSLDTPGGTVTLTVPAGSQSGRRLRLRGRGLPRSGGQRGDLHAVARIVVPSAPTAAERAAYEALRQAAGGRADQPAGGRR
jgi:curved DNA-binding protein